MTELRPGVPEEDLAAVEEIRKAIHQLPVEDHDRVERGMAYAALHFERTGSTAELQTFLHSLIITVRRHRSPDYRNALADAELEDWDVGAGASADDLTAAARQRRVERRRRG